MAVSLIALDLDGTTLTEHKYLSQGNRRALEEAARRGIILVPASGRMKDFLPEEITSLPGVRYVITANGAGVYDLKENKNIWQCLIPNEKAREVQDLLAQYDLFVEYYDRGRSITRKGDPERATDLAKARQRLAGRVDYWQKINLPYLSTPQLRREVWQRIEALGGLHLTSSIPDNIEVNVQGADKGHALEALAQRLGIPQQEVMALGDNGNDVTMLQYAGVSVAMGDGSPEAKAAAKYVTVSHTEDGLARALERFALI